MPAVQALIALPALTSLPASPHPRPRLALDRGLGARDLETRLTTTTDTSNVARRRLPRAGDHSQKSRVLVHWLLGSRSYPSSPNQQDTVPFVRIPQVCQTPALTAANVPAGA